MIIKKITAMIKAIKTFFIKTNGILVIHHNHVPNEVNDYYMDITKDLEMLELSEDKKNMRNDGFNLKLDIKKAVSSYKSEFCNG